MLADYYDIGRARPSDFEYCLETDFVVDLEYLGIQPDGTPKEFDGTYSQGETSKLRLVEVVRRDQLHPEFRKVPFTLLFFGSLEEPLYSDIHVLTHERLGRMMLLLTSVNVTVGHAPESAPEGRFYEVVFN